MKWQEVRVLYPNQFVKFQVMKYHIKDDFEYVDEIALIGPVDEENATRELLESKENILVYHTSKEEVKLKIRTRIGLRRAY
ncbi:conserved hypothetical protein [Alkaliphilus metalliredigens QYMF]|uniref:Uncharacterized protein n=1 Tax=Alkaliphilus metalliredigens (strain QYMF) TaxID=293826 RepID=A6TQ24_ALKMQ|nr:hypothetical protein [Alkaliphilus metalliredigens]ABR48292.1 conserved hypothetical protein [Alkaliphilus metalliredigens QYMF]